MKVGTPKDVVIIRPKLDKVFTQSSLPREEGYLNTPQEGYHARRRSHCWPKKNWAKLSLGTFYHRGPSPNPNPPSEHRRYMASATPD
uniref:Uncharacterized protein n=1 Tax=Oryza barthii TaxID=65489 RepID=A0A0D3F8Y0_9ORYZ